MENSIMYGLFREYGDNYSLIALFREKEKAIEYITYNYPEYKKSKRVTNLWKYADSSLIIRRLKVL